MAAVKSASFLVLLFLGSGASGLTCRGQSTGDPVPKEAAPAPTATEVTLPGIDASALTPRERREWSSYVQEFLSPCSDVPVPIAQCVTEKRKCSRCLPAAKFLLQKVRDGLSRDQVEQAYKGRFNADRIKDVAIDGSPTKGPENARVTIVEFADFECPFCGKMAPPIEKLASDHHDDVRVVYKFMPLPAHPHGELAARAGFAAHLQGKFWDMNRKMFANQKFLEQSDLEGYAKELGLDVKKFRTDMQSQAATDRLAKDRKLADALEVKGTPTLYVNGRLVEQPTELEEWVTFELALLGGSKADASAPASTQAPTPSAAGGTDGGATAGDGGANRKK